MRKGKLHYLVWLMCLLTPFSAMALTLGDMVVRSLPGEPLRAHIPIKLEANEQLADIHASLLSAEEYGQRRIDYPPVLQGLQVALLDKGNGRGRIQLFGQQLWQGDGAEFLLRLQWLDSQLEQSFMLSAVTSDEESTPVYVEVAENENLDAIAMRLSKGRNRSYLHMMYALFQANPDAFYRGNLNNLKGGVTLRVPSDEELYRYSDREVFDGIRQQYLEWQQMRGVAPQAGSQAGEALAGMSAEQVETLDLSASPDALQKRLQQVVADGEAIRKENEELRQRLRALEERMQNVAGHVLDYAAEEPAAEKVPAAQQPKEPPSRKAEEESTKPAETGQQSLSGTTLLAAIVLALLFAFYIWFSTGHPHKGRE